MGCGKSSVGRRLSELLCCPFMDLDQVIEEQAGRTIREIFSQDGEQAFRQMELNALKHVVSEGRSKTKSLPRLRRGPLPFTRPRAAMVFDTPLTDHQHPTTTLQKGNNCTRHCEDMEEKWEDALVVALGGGAVMTPECAEIVHSETKCIYLHASIDTLMEHLEGQTANRPLLNTPHYHSERAQLVEESVLRNRINDLMAKRSSTYEKTAHVIIDIDGKSIEAVASEIASTLQ